MSKLTICNEALGHLAMKPITQEVLDANEHPSAIACNLYFDSCRKDVLREHQWPFANAQHTLEALDEEVVGWLFVYSYPLFAANIWTVYSPGTLETIVPTRFLPQPISITKDEQDFEIKYFPDLGVSVICSNIEDALADISYDVEDTDQWDSQFIEAFTYKLAAKMAHSLIGDPSIGTAMMNIFMSKISDAKRVASSEQLRKPPQSSGYKNAR